MHRNESRFVTQPEKYCLQACTKALFSSKILQPRGSEGVNGGIYCPRPNRCPLGVGVGGRGKESVGGGA